jgi:lipoprotein-anchoring transpeptidase ErfK/SrfK
MRQVLRVLLAAGAVFLAPEIADALVRIDIDLSSQRMHVASGSGETYDWPISSGRPGHLTPRGFFRPIALYPMVHSLKYDNAPMPHSIFFLSEYAIHGTNAVGHLGRPASHGCVRLAPGAAARLYALVEDEGATIRIHGDIGAEEHRPGVIRHRRENPAIGYGYEPVRPAWSVPEWEVEPIDGY